MIEINEKKLNRQLIGINKWVHSKDHNAPANGCGTLWWYTAVGKTYAALIAANRLFSKNPDATVVVIVPSEELVKQWKQEIKEHIKEPLWTSIKVFTIHYLVENNAKIKCDLLIADEIHEYLTPERLRFLERDQQISYKWILGLTATWEDSKHRQRSLASICPVVDRISEQEALKEGFISKYIEYNLACSFNQEEFAAYKAHSTIIAKHLSKFGNMLDVAQKCLVGGKHTDGKSYTGFGFSTGWAYRSGWYANGDPNDEEYSKIDDLWNPHKVIGYAKLLMTSIRERKDIIYNVQDKCLKAAEITQKFKTLKTICFAQSTAFADKLNLLINKVEPNACVVYHSKMDTIIRDGKKVGKVVLKREAIEKIKTGAARVISTASALDKGFNVEDIRLGITSSGTQNPTQHSQRGGRVKRLELFSPDVVDLIVNLYVPDTVDEKWLRNRQKKSTNTVYWVDSLDEITYTPVENNVFNLTNL